MAINTPTRRTNPWPLVAIVTVVTLMIAAGVVFFLAKGSGDCGGTTKLRIAASQDKVQLLQMAGDAYAKDAEVGGKCVSITVDSKNSGTAKEALARGWSDDDGPRPDIWSPASSQWAALLREQSPKAPVTGTSWPAIMTTPLTIAMPKPMAEALGWPDKQIGWRDLAELATSAGWSTKGHPEWGTFKLGKTNPNYSTSGFNATLAAYFAATGSTSDLVPEDLTAPKNREFVGNIEKSIVHYGDTLLTFFSNLQRADDRGEALNYISAVTAEETFVWNYNQGNPTIDPTQIGEHAKPKVPVVAFYPSEGTVLSDHPFVELTWMDAQKKRAADDFLEYLHSGPGQKFFTDHGYRGWKGEPGASASKDFGVLAEQPKIKLPLPAASIMQGVLNSWTELRKPAKVLLVLDKSGSMSQKVPGTDKSKLDLAKAAAINALKEFAPQDQVALWQFSSKLVGDQDYQQIVPFGGMAGAHRDQLKNALSGLRVQGGTGLYNTTAAAYDTLRGAKAAGAINAVVVMTDGQNDRRGGIEDLETLTGRLAAKEGEPVRVFTLAFGDGADLETLTKIAQATDGAAYDSKDPNSISQVFSELLSNF
ncbi:substrate-binding and VWA domain-containing protein [Actinocorallia longicatena]|uniref:Substrate-binding and VWA domain-containing protein n=1 Tax=Actinocorallia longicatena TaxID=111803 RepID=A0ABP6QH82_9ACTN